MAELPKQLSDGYLLAAILQTDSVLTEVQRQLKQLYPNLQLTVEQIRELIRTSALRHEVLTGAGLEGATAQLAEVRDLAAAAAANSEGTKGNRQVRITGTYKAVPPKDEEDHDLWQDKMMSTGGG
ncbi:MAG TPA: hypothetical protein VKQ72_00535 [Aggregatilineales bacterium]|nr:hypothetical protein [Aggregatilineales bacterium]